MNDSHHTQLLNINDSLSESPITRLPHDILWKIFLTNTKIVDAEDRHLHPLFTSRYSSQVCCTWRHIILDTPALWGKLIDLDHMKGEENTRWRHEVLLRSGSSHLQVRGCVRDLVVWKYLLIICTTHWARIQDLQITIIFADSRCNDEAKLWDALQRSAPVLQSFKFDFNHSNVQSIRPSPSSLFANHAPLLEVFDAGPLKFNLKAPWMSNLRQVHISHFFTVADILNVLKFMPLLASLHLDDLDHIYPRGSSNKRSPLPSVHLPRLTVLRVKDITLPICLIILQEISPASGCSLELYIRQEYPHPQKCDETLQAASNQLTGYMRGCVTSQTASSIQFFCDQEQEEAEFQLSVYDSQHNLRFQIAMRDHWDLSEIFMASLTSSLFLSQVEKVGLTVSNGPRDFIYRVISFLGSLKSVTMLETSEVELEFIYAVNMDKSMRALYFIYMNNPFPVLFPILHTIALDYILDPRQREVSAIEAFLKQREAIGLPVSVLDLTRVPPEQLMFDMDCLKEISGLDLQLGY